MDGTQVGSFWHVSAIPKYGPQALFLWASSSGGGLPGRPATRKSRDARLIFERIFNSRSMRTDECRRVDQRRYFPIHSALPRT